MVWRFQGTASLYTLTKSITFDNENQMLIPLAVPKSPRSSHIELTGFLSVQNFLFLAEEQEKQKQLDGDGRNGED